MHNRQKRIKKNSGKKKLSTYPLEITLCAQPKHFAPSSDIFWNALPVSYEPVFHLYGWSGAGGVAVPHVHVQIVVRLHLDLTIDPLLDSHVGARMYGRPEEQIFVETHGVFEGSGAIAGVSDRPVSAK